MNAVTRTDLDDLRDIVHGAVLAAELPTRQDIDTIEAYMRRMPQINNLDTRHVLAGGIYGRMLTSPAGSIIVGKVHRHDHVYIVASGTIIVLGEGSRETITGPAMLAGRPGTKRVVLMLTDATRIAVNHVGELMDLDEIERHVVEPDPAALFDARNELRPPALEVIP